MIQERLQNLRAKMQENGVQAYIIPTSDFHETEYVSDYFACRKYMSGFTGSAGTLVVLTDQAGLWTDGRYFIQAQAQLQDTGITLMKMGQPETPSIEDYICQNLSKGSKVGFDGRVINYMDYKRYHAIFNSHQIDIVANLDLVNEIWQDRPALPATKTFHYALRYAGVSMEDKLAQVRQAMTREGCASFIITKIDEIAWLFNIRAHDIPHFPVALAYATIEKEKAT